MVCDEGASGVGTHIIVEGTEEVTSKHCPAVTLGAGSSFGEIALLDGGRRSATVTALTPVIRLSIVAWDFLTLLDNDPNLVRRLLLEMCRRMREQVVPVSH